MATRALFRSAALAVCFSSIGLAALFVVWRHGPTSSELPDWEVVQGAIRRLAVTEEGPLFETREAKLRRTVGPDDRGITITFDRPTRFVLPVTDASPQDTPPKGGGGAVEHDALALPRLLRGEALVVTEPGVRLGVAGEVLNVESPARLRLRDGEIELLTGVVLGATVRLVPGSPFSFTRLATAERVQEPIRVEPTPATSNSIPGATPPSGKPAVTGKVVDAFDEEPISGARVTLVSTRLDDGYPPVPLAGGIVVERTGADGTFAMPSVGRQYPDLQLRIQVQREGYLPRVVHLGSGRDRHGMWKLPVVRLRRARTASVQLLDPDGWPLPHTATTVVIDPADRFVGEDVWEREDSLRPDRPQILYTDDEGRLIVGTDPLTIELHHPTLYPLDPDTDKPRRTIFLNPLEDDQGRYPRELFYRIETREPRDIRSYTLFDADGEPVTDTLVELEDDSGDWCRVYTDAAGSLVLGVFPHAPQAPASVRSPREVLVTTLSPRLWKAQMKLWVPRTEPRWELPTRMGRTLFLRLVESRGDGPGADDLAPIRWPAPFELDDGLSLTETHESGHVVFEGALPGPGDRLDFRVPGYWSRTIVVPSYPPDLRELDLGNVALERGDTLALIADARHDATRQRAQVVIAAVDVDDPPQTVRFAQSARQEVSGLRRGFLYRYAVEGQGVEPVHGEFRLSEEILRQGWTVSVVSDRWRAIRLQGRVRDVIERDSPRYRVIERFRSGAHSEPLTYRSYPLRPDGSFGSVRVLPPDVSAEVFVVGPDSTGCVATPKLDADRGVFDAGELLLVDQPRARLAFEAEGVGRVAPPRDFGLFSSNDQEQQIARFHLEGRATLVLSNLLPGGYSFRWERTESGSPPFREAVVFEVDEGTGQKEVTATRRARLRERILASVVDTKGQPYPGEAHVTARTIDVATSQSERGETSDGVRPGIARTVDSLIEVDIAPLEESRFEVRSDVSPALRVSVPASARVPDPIVLPRRSSVRALVLDTTGERFHGTLRVEWQPVSETESRPGPAPGVRLSSARYLGGELEVAVVNGILESNEFPSGRSVLRLYDTASEMRSESTHDVSERGQTRLGTIRLTEGRRIEGVVRNIEDEPVAGATVAVVDEGALHTYPFQERSLVGVRFLTRSDGLGRYTIDGLPFDLDAGSFLLVDHEDYLYSYTPLSPSSDGRHDLVLREVNELAVEVGYRRVPARTDYEFRLTHIDPHSPDTVRVELGAIPFERHRGNNETRIFRGVRPGLYRLTWDLKEPFPELANRSREVFLEPGTAGALELRVDATFIDGSATYNEERLRRGWVIVMENPMDRSTWHVGRVRRGSFEVAAPQRARRAHVTLIPETGEPRQIDFSRGQALPVRVDNWSQVMRRGHLPITYECSDFQIEFREATLRGHRDLEIEFPHYEWSDVSRTFRAVRRREPLTGRSYSLYGLPRGDFFYRVTSRGGFRHFSSIRLQEPSHSVSL